MRCARHPKVETRISCSSCGKPICPDCIVYTPVGGKCEACARQPAAAMVRLKPDRLVMMIAVGVAASAVAAVVFLMLAGLASFLMLFLAFGLGHAVGEAVSWASGRYRDRPVAIWAAACAAAAIVVPQMPALLRERDPMYSVLELVVTMHYFWILLAAAIAAFAAWRRNA